MNETPASSQIGVRGVLDFLFVHFGIGPESLIDESGKIRYFSQIELFKLLPLEGESIDKFEKRKGRLLCQIGELCFAVQAAFSMRQGANFGDLMYDVNVYCVDHDLPQRFPSCRRTTEYLKAKMERDQRDSDRLRRLNPPPFFLSLELFKDHCERLLDELSQETGVIARTKEVSVLASTPKYLEEIRILGEAVRYHIQNSGVSIPPVSVSINFVCSREELRGGIEAYRDWIADAMAGKNASDKSIPEELLSVLAPRPRQVLEFLWKKSTASAGEIASAVWRETVAPETVRKTIDRLNESLAKAKSPITVDFQKGQATLRGRTSKTTQS